MTIATFPWAAKIEAASPEIRAELERVLAAQGRIAEFPGHRHRRQDASPPIAAGRPSFSWASARRRNATSRSAPRPGRPCRTFPGSRRRCSRSSSRASICPPHRGPYNGVLRLASRLDRAGAERQARDPRRQQICHWQEGKVLIFDDAYEHEAWNHTDKTRVVLFVDFVKPLRFPANFVNWLLMNLARLHALHP